MKVIDINFIWSILPFTFCIGFIVQMLIGINSVSNVINDGLKIFLIIISIFLLIKGYEKANGNNDIAINHLILSLFTMAFFYFVSYIHHLDGAVISDVKSKTTINEIIRLFSFVIILLSYYFYDKRNIDKVSIIRWLIIIGIVISSVTVYHSIFGKADNLGRYVLGVLRAGSEIIDSNLLGGILNFFTALSISAIFISGISYKLLILLVFSIVARSLTFSTSSFIAFIIMMFIFLFLYLVKPNVKMKLLKLTLSFFLFFMIMVTLNYTGILDLIMYRVMMSDSYVYEASIGSRLTQYENSIIYIMNNPSDLLLGVGANYIPYVTGTGFDIHNSIFRVLLVGGVIPLLAHVYIIYMFLKLSVNILITSWKKFDQVGILEMTFSISVIGWVIQMQTLPADTSLVLLIYMSLFVIIKKLNRY